MEKLTKEQAADILRISAYTLSRWRSKGIGPPAVKVGRQFRYPSDLLQKWIDDQVMNRPKEEAG